nr:hypothetical protein [Tanacetum cinerariifolium]
MYIHDVTLEGFKSYGVKAKFEVSLDFPLPKNCSGHGQDAVTKAIVSLALKSLDQSPSLLAVTREIDRDGSALYKVNDTATTDVGVKHLFLSQQLNVKNPYVLITKEDVAKALSMMIASDFQTLLVNYFLIGSSTRANLQDKAKEARDAAYSKISKAVLTIKKIDNEKRILEDELIKLNKTLSQDEYKNLKEKCDHLYEQVHAERAKESDLKSQIIDKQVEHIKELDDCSSFFFSPDKKKKNLMPNEAMSLSEQQQQEVAKFKDDVAQHLKKEKSFLFVCESVLSALMDDLREVEARIHMLEGEREEWQGEADAFLSKASNLRLQLLHTNEKKKLKIREFNTTKKKKQELHND